MRLEPPSRVRLFSLLPDFNSIKVRLEHIIGYLARALQVFQFHKGAIRTSREATSITNHPNFNSIKVRLERFAVSVVAVKIDNFNSIKVRLEPATTWKSYTTRQFQFHKGAIRTGIGRQRFLYAYFNSIKVRLERPTWLIR